MYPPLKVFIILLPLFIWVSRSLLVSFTCTLPPIFQFIVSDKLYYSKGYNFAKVFKVVFFTAVSVLAFYKYGRNLNLGIQQSIDYLLITQGLVYLSIVIVCSYLIKITEPKEMLLCHVFKMIRDKDTIDADFLENKEISFLSFTKSEPTTINKTFDEDEMDVFCDKLSSKIKPITKDFNDEEINCISTRINEKLEPKIKDLNAQEIESISNKINSKLEVKTKDLNDQEIESISNKIKSKLDVQTKDLNDQEIESISNKINSKLEPTSKDLNDVEIFRISKLLNDSSNKHEIIRNVELELIYHTIENFKNVLTISEDDKENLIKLTRGVHISKIEIQVKHYNGNLRKKKCIFRRC